MAFTQEINKSKQVGANESGSDMWRGVRKKEMMEWISKKTYLFGNGILDNNNVSGNSRNDFTGGWISVEDGDILV